MKREQKGALLASKLREYPAVAADLAKIKAAFSGVSLKYIKFVDGTEIGEVDDHYTESVEWLCGGAVRQHGLVVSQSC